MEELGSMSGHLVEFIVAFFIVGMVLYGHYKGFIRLAVSVAAIFITLAVVRLTAPGVADWLKNETPVYENIRADLSDTLGLGGDQSRFLEDPDGLRQENFIETLDLPIQIKKLLNAQNNKETYRRLGVELFGDYIASFLAETILNIAVFVGLFFLVRLLLYIGMIWLDLLAKLPILSGLNQIAGAILGGLEGLIFLWLAALIVTALSGTPAGAAVLREVAASSWLSWLYEHNFLTWLAIGFVTGLL